MNNIDDIITEVMLDEIDEIDEEFPVKDKSRAARRKKTVRKSFSRKRLHDRYIEEDVPIGRYFKDTPFRREWDTSPFEVWQQCDVQKPSVRRKMDKADYGTREYRKSA